MGLVRDKINEYSSQKDLVWRTYVQEGTRGVASLIGVSYGTVGHVIRAYGFLTEEAKKKRLLDSREFTSGYNPFTKWNEDSAYLYGYFLGDGSLTESSENGLYHISYSSSDKENLESILRKLKREQIGVSHNSRGNYRFQFSSSSVQNSLILLGMVPRKSIVGGLIERPPESVMHHFVRGLFDSDGTVGIMNRKYLKTILWGHPSYINQIQEWLSWFTFNEEIRNNQNSPIKGLSMYDRERNEDFYKFIYRDATICISRKRQVYERILL